LAGIPTRLVGGYLGGEYNDLGGYYVVTEDRAHVWVEAYLDGKGWVRVDPSRWAVNAGEVGTSAKRGAFRSLLLAVDTVTYFWNRQVITYDLERQISLFNEAGRRLHGVKPPRMEGLPKILAMVVIPLLILWGACLLLRRPSTEARLVAAFIARLRDGYGIEATQDAGLRELTAGIEDPDVARFVEIHGGAIYRDRRLTPEEMAELRGIIKKMKKG
jgi:PAS domain-containing protein